MAGNENGKNVETVESKAPLLWIFFLAMGLVTLTALGDEIIDYFGTDQERTTTESYYQSKCHEIETSGFPSFAVNEYKDHGNKGADWGKNYPPYCALAAQYVSANSAARNAVWNKWMLFLTGVGVVLLWRTLDLTREALIETREATKAAQAAVVETRKIGAAQTRAYLSVASIDLPKAIKKLIEGKEVTPRLPPGASLGYEITIENIGQSPAYSVLAGGTLTIYSRNSEKCVVQMEKRRIGCVPPKPSPAEFLGLFAKIIGPEPSEHFEPNWVNLNLSIFYRDIFQKEGEEWHLEQDFSGSFTSYDDLTLINTRESYVKN